MKTVQKPKPLFPSTQPCCTLETSHFLPYPQALAVTADTPLTSGIWGWKEAEVSQSLQKCSELQERSSLCKGNSPLMGAPASTYLHEPFVSSPIIQLALPHHPST